LSKYTLQVSYPVIYVRAIDLLLTSLSLSHTHTHTHTHSSSIPLL
jgi:hypothetical protein